MTKSVSTRRRAVAAAVLMLSPASALDAPSLVSRYGLSISECDGLLSSEISDDFGPPLTPQESADLWNAATAQRWSVAASDGANHPFIVCEKTPDTSGYGRKNILKGMLNIPIGDGDIDTVYSDYKEMGCFLISANANALAEALENPPDGYGSDALRVQPVGPGLKMLGGSVDAVRGWIDRANAGSPASPPVEVASASEEGQGPLMTAYSSAAFADMLRLDLNLCPAAEQAPLGDTSSDILAFLADNGGDAVRTSSFVYDLTGEVSDRIDFWSSHMKNVLATFDGGEQCLSALRQDTIVDGSDLEYGSLRVFLPTQEMGDGWEDCVWYAVRSLALHRSVCRMDYVEDVTVLPPAEDVVGMPGEDVSTDPTAPSIDSTLPTTAAAEEGSQPNSSSQNDEELPQESESEDPSESDEGTENVFVRDADSGAEAGLYFSGVSSITAILVARWVMLL